MSEQSNVIKSLLRNCASFLLQVSGVAALVTAVIQFGLQWFDKGFLVFLIMRGLAGLFNICWTIAGSVWVFGSWNSDLDFNEGYCDKTTYLFSFIMLILTWLSYPLFFLVAFLLFAIFRGFCKGPLSLLLLFVTGLVIFVTAVIGLARPDLLG